MKYFVAKFTRPNNSFFYDVVNSKELHLFEGQKFELITDGYLTFDEALSFIHANKL